MRKPLGLRGGSQTGLTAWYTWHPLPSVGIRRTSRARKFHSVEKGWLDRLPSHLSSMVV